MSVYSRGAFVRALQGQLLRHSERREVAIFLRDGVLWVADFIDARGHPRRCRDLVLGSTAVRRGRRTHAGGWCSSRQFLFPTKLVARIGRLPAPRFARGRGASVRAWRVAASRGRVEATIARLLGRRRAS